MNYSRNTHPMSSDYGYDPKFSSIYPNSVDKVHTNRQQSPTCSTTPSSGIDIVDEDSTGTYSSNSESLVILSDMSSSSSSHSRQVIIKSVDEKVIISNKPRRRRPRRRFRRRQRNHFIREKELMNRKRSSISFSKDKHYYSSSKRWDHKDSKLKYLYDEYSSEDIHREWRPLTFTESEQLYQYALDKHHKN